MNAGKMLDPRDIGSSVRREMGKILEMLTLVKIKKVLENPVLLLVAFIFGLWVIADGVGSIIVYWSQTSVEHLVRLIRIVAGVYLVAFVYVDWRERGKKMSTQYGGDLNV